MPTEADLLAAIRANPYDDDARLVYANWLLERGDPRGELLVLEHRETTERLNDREALTRLLDLAAEHGFLRIPDEPAFERLPFETTNDCPVRYDLHHDGHDYVLFYEEFVFEVWIDDEKLEVLLDTGGLSSYWSTEQAAAILWIVSDAIRMRRLREIELPSSAAMHAHYHRGVRRDHERWCHLWDRLAQL